MFMSLLLLAAMENWGLVTYKECVLLVDPVNTSQVTKQYVALVVGKCCLIWCVAIYSYKCYYQ